MLHIINKLKVFNISIMTFYKKKQYMISTTKASEEREVVWET